MSYQRVSTISGDAWSDPFEAFKTAFEKTQPNLNITEIYVASQDAGKLALLSGKPVEIKVFTFKLDPDASEEQIQKKLAKIERWVKDHRILFGTQDSILAHKNLGLGSEADLRLRNADEHPDKKRDFHARVKEISDDQYKQFEFELLTQLGIPLNVMGESIVGETKAKRRGDKPAESSHSTVLVRRESRADAGEARAKHKKKTVSVKTAAHMVQEHAAKQRANEKARQERKETTRRKEEKKLKGYEDRREHKAEGTKKFETQKTVKKAGKVKSSKK